MSRILKPIWHLNTFEISLLTSTALLASAVGAIIFGRIADVFGRKFIYGYELIVLAAGAIASAIAPGLIWRLLLGLGAVPALATFWLRRQIAETPRFALAQGNAQEVSRAVDTVQPEQEPQSSSIDQGNKVHWQDSFAVRHWLIWLIGAAGTWFLLDIAYYGTTVSSPFVIKLFSPKSTLETTMLHTLFIFVLAALPGYIFAIFLVDRIGRKVMQLLGFAMMAISFGLLFSFPALTTITWSFLLLYGASYFFTEFGPNVTTFLYPAEIFPVNGTWHCSFVRKGRRIHWSVYISSNASEFSI